MFISPVIFFTLFCWFPDIGSGQQAMYMIMYALWSEQGILGLLSVFLFILIKRKTLIPEARHELFENWNNILTVNWRKCFYCLLTSITEALIIIRSVTLIIVYVHPYYSCNSYRNAKLRHAQAHMHTKRSHQIVAVALKITFIFINTYH